MHGPLYNIFILPSVPITLLFQQPALDEVLVWVAPFHPWHQYNDSLSRARSLLSIFREHARTKRIEYFSDAANERHLIISSMHRISSKCCLWFWIIYIYPKTLFLALSKTSLAFASSSGLKKPTPKSINGKASIRIDLYTKRTSTEPLNNDESPNIQQETKKSCPTRPNLLLLKSTISRNWTSSHPPLPGRCARRPNKKYPFGCSIPSSSWWHRDYNPRQPARDIYPGGLLWGCWPDQSEQKSLPQLHANRYCR